MPDDYATSVVVGKSPSDALEVQVESPEGFAQPANSFHPAALIELLSRRNRQTGEQSSLAVDETFQEIEQLLQPVLAEALLNVAVDDKALG